MNKLQHLQYLNLNRPSRYADNITAIQARPSLDLNFARNKSLMDNVTGNNLVTFTRASSGTYVGEDGLIKTAAVNEPRFDHNPTTGESLGLLVEEQRTNLNTDSEDFTGYGSSSGSVTGNQGAAPNGTLTADQIASTGGGLFKSISGTTAATVYTASVYAKYVSGGNLFNFGFDSNPSSGRADFNLQTGALGAADANVISRSITALPNGWYLCSVTATVTSTNTIIVFYNGTSGSNFLVWGAQLEAGAFHTSYIPTTTAAATRSADVASITGTNFSSWYRQDEGTISLQASTSGANAGFLTLSDGSVADYIRMGRGFGLFNFLVSTAGGAQADLYTNGSSLVLGQPFRSAGSYRVNDFATCLNGLGLATDTAGSLPSAANELNIGFGLYTGYINGHIRRLTYFPQRISNANLQRITQ